MTCRFENYDGKFSFDPEDLSTSKADFTIRVASVNKQSEKRDTHLQYRDFFGAQKFAVIRFVSYKFEKKGKDKFAVHGKLTIKNVIKEIDLPFTVLGATDHPMMNGTKVMGR